MSTIIEEATGTANASDVGQVDETQQSGPELLRIRTDRTYKFPAGTKTRHQFLTIKKDGTVSYRNPACIEYAKPGSKPFRLSALNPRTDKPGVTFARLKEAIDNRAGKDREGNCKRFVGRNVADGYRIVATDGTVALLEKRAVKDGTFVDWQEGTAGEYSKVFDSAFAAARIVSTVSNKEFHLALKRADVMADPRSHKVQLIGLSNRLHIASLDPDCGSFSETLPVQSSTFWSVAFDFRLLEPVMGTWPLLVRFTNRETAVCFEPADGSWRYVVMPYKTDDHDAAEQEAYIRDAEISNEPDQAAADPNELDQKTSPRISNRPNQKKPMEELCVF